MTLKDALQAIKKQNHGIETSLWKIKIKLDRKGKPCVLRLALQGDLRFVCGA